MSEKVKLINKCFSIPEIRISSEGKDPLDEGMRKELNDLRSRMQEMLMANEAANELLEKRAMLPYSGWFYFK
jgi:hypothetical protein